MERAAARDTVDGDDGADRDQYGGEAKRCREPDGVVTVVSVQGFGSEAVALVEAEADDRIPRFLADDHADSARGPGWWFSCFTAALATPVRVPGCLGFLGSRMMDQ